MLPVEIRNNICSYLKSEQREVYTYKDLHGLTFYVPTPFAEPSHLKVNDTPRTEILGGYSADRYCNIRIEERSMISDFLMHDPDAKDQVAGVS